jgi:hypothetical protein
MEHLKKCENENCENIAEIKRDPHGIPVGRICDECWEKDCPIDLYYPTQEFDGYGERLEP